MGGLFRAREKEGDVVWGLNGEREREKKGVENHEKSRCSFAPSSVCEFGGKRESRVEREEWLVVLRWGGGTGERHKDVVLWGGCWVVLGFFFKLKPFQKTF